MVFLEKNSLWYLLISSFEGRVWVIYVQALGHTKISLSWVICEVLWYLQVPGAAEKSGLSWVRLAVQRKNSKRKQRENLALDWKFGTLGFRWPKLLAWWERCNLYFLISIFIILLYFIKFISIFFKSSFFFLFSITPQTQQKFSPVDLGCRTYQLHLCWGERHLSNKCPGYNSKLSEVVGNRKI